jgi:hypothetical protein
LAIMASVARTCALDRRAPVRATLSGRQRRARCSEHRVDHARAGGRRTPRARERARGGDPVDERGERGAVRPGRRHERRAEADDEPERGGAAERHGQQHRHARRVPDRERRRDSLGAQQGGQVVGHRLEREPPVGGRLGAPVPRQVDGHHGAVLGEPRRHVAPRARRRAGAVHEQCDGAAPRRLEVPAAPERGDAAGHRRPPEGRVRGAAGVRRFGVHDPRPRPAAPAPLAGPAAHPRAARLPTRPEVVWKDASLRRAPP